MKKLLCLLVIFSIVFVSCATIMHGTKQEIGFASSPSGAKVSANGEFLGNTPLLKELKRKNHYIIKIELDGYLPYETTMTRHISGWVWGNIVFGGLIGLAVDAISGGLYKISPEQVQAELLKGELAANVKSIDDVFFITVVLEPDKNWEKIGQLKQKR